MINKFLLSAITRLITVALIFAVLHFLLIEKVLPQVYGTGPYWAIYLFVVPLSILVIVVSALVYKADKTAVGRTYFVFVFIKMFASVGFLAPWLFWKNEYSHPMVYQFFCLFFSLLFVEIKLLIGLLNTPSDEMSKNHENQ